MSIGIQACDIVLPGYVLSERIGSGGYAEVWRAEAPGGIEKAVKIVYGYHNDEFAAQELKSLERIKGVRHPFLLSLERFEVVNGRLAILTELADMSLDQRLSQCQSEGLPGIPRAELLRYMSDAAEALDFLSQRHNLLHLDIKPENLLISGDHIKVADFGLVKELATRTQNSLVSGMTPTYAAPEIFDDEPSVQSDQYSLAIVYQQMLVGTLPFPGRTAAQLAKQHTQSEPQLISLPADDRQAVARALAKKPTDRFPSCSAFVDTLLHRTQVLPTAAPAELPRPIPAVPPSTPDPDDTKPSSACATLRRTSDKAPLKPDVTFTQPVRRETSPPAPSKIEPTVIPATFVAEETVDVAVPTIDQHLRREQPTLYVAAGGVGIQLLCKLRELTASQDESAGINTAIESLALDTDRNELREACSGRWKSPLSPSDTLHLPLRLPKSYDDSRAIHGWVSRRWLYNIPRSLETRGYRPLGRVALVDHYQRVRDLIDKKLQRLGALTGAADAMGEPRDGKIKVVILAGTGGGTGAGTAIDIANAAKSLAVARGLQAEVHGFFVCTCFASNNLSPLVAANTYSLLTELNHVMALGNESPSEAAARTQLFESREAPFDCVSWMPAISRTTDANSTDALSAAAKYLALEWTPDARTVLRSCRVSPTPREQSRGRLLTLRMSGYASLADQKHEFIGELACDLAAAVRRHWLTDDTSADWERLVHEEQQHADGTPKLETAKDDSNTPPDVVPVNDATALALRGRFKEFMRIEFTSEVLRQIQRQLESRDDRGRPLILARDAKLIADTARAAVSSFPMQTQQDSCSSRFAKSSILRPLIVACSRRVLSQRVENFDPRQPDNFLPAGAVDDLIQIESRTLLEESPNRPDLSAAIAALIDLDKATSAMYARAIANTQQYGSERRILLFVPLGDAHCEATQKLQVAMPLAKVVPVAVDDVFLVSEEAGISPRVLANGIESAFPGVADAARRLHTRIDVNWQSLI
jgi:serine/threonine protein kinase